jgi:hypothetical protein
MGNGKYVDLIGLDVVFASSMIAEHTNEQVCVGLK